MAQPLALGLITSLHPDPQEALSAVRDLQIPTVQVAYRAELDNEAGMQAIRAALQETGIEITAVFCGFEGESYNDIPDVRATVGLVPEATRAERVEKTRRIGEFAHELGVQCVAAHIGFVPEDEGDPRYHQIVETVRGICAELAARGQLYTLETGQETAATLQRFIGDVGAQNLRVNFDPANMILYGNDNPIEATRLLGPWIAGAHCKDGQWPTAQDQLGHETPLGDGDVNVPMWIETLVGTGYRGALTIEREISGEEQRRDIARARDLLNGVLIKVNTA